MLIFKIISKLLNQLKIITIQYSLYAVYKQRCQNYLNIDSQYSSSIIYIYIFDTGLLIFFSKKLLNYQNLLIQYLNWIMQ